MKKGFTLIELLVVISIVTLLTAILSDGFGNSREKSRVIKRISHLREMRSALELYNTKYSHYPNTLNGVRHDCLAPSPKPDDYVADLVSGKPFVPEFFPELQHDPLNESCSISTGGYYYAYRSNGTDYKLWGPYKPGGSMESCNRGFDIGFGDPQRPCGGGDEGWAVFTPGAVTW
ncbi:MAG: type II secretion system protein [bacterium]|nr:type II secretion system protein [bacterium]